MSSQQDLELSTRLKEVQEREIMRCSQKIRNTFLFVPGPCCLLLQFVTDASFYILHVQAILQLDLR